MSELTCACNIGVGIECSGIVKLKDLLDQQTKVPICEACYDGNNRLLEIFKENNFNSDKTLEIFKKEIENDK